MSETVEALLARGDYEAAARAAEASGDLRRAIALYERVWKFAEALPLAITLGDRPLAVRLALEARLGAHAQEIAAQIPDDDLPALTRAAESFAGRGQHEPAGDLLLRAGRVEEAAAQYRRAGVLVRAAAALESAGRLQEAGRLLERAIAEAPEAQGPETAEAQLALGRLLSRLGRHKEAARSLQTAVSHEATRAEAQRRLCGELLALGLPFAAEVVAQRLHAEHPELSDDPESIAAAERDAEETLSAVTPQRFRIKRTLGAGGLGRVYEAEDELLGRTVAVKVLSIGAGATGPERDAFARFVREAEAAGRLRHPNIVAVHELEASAGLMVLEHLSGGTLADKLAREGALSPPSVRRLALELLAALGAAHRAGIVHRDVKPPNIFFDAAGNAKLGDFGAAHLVDFGHTQTGSFIGTLAYLSPEQITGSPIGFAADLYALAVTLYEALCGRPPYLGPDLVAQHLTDNPPPPTSVRPGLAAVHDEVLLRALSKAPSDRYASAEAMAQAVERWPALGTGVPSRRTERPSVRMAVVVPDAPPRELVGRGPHSTLYATVDPRVGRAVLVEELDQPLDEQGAARVRALAAAGGPYAQRMLDVSADLRHVTWERLDGDETSVRSLPRDEAALLTEVWPTLAPLGVTAANARVVRTAGGPVVLLAIVTVPRRTAA